jgi:hypothetical protein
MPSPEVAASVEMGAWLPWTSGRRDSAGLTDREVAADNRKIIPLRVGEHYTSHHFATPRRRGVTYFRPRAIRPGTPALRDRRKP